MQLSPFLIIGNQKMLKPQQLIQICVYPRIYNILSFYSKGSYSIGISLIQQQDGKVTRSFKPFIMTKNDHKGLNSKKATERLRPDSKIHEFMTEQFYVTYNQESAFFSSMCVFKVEVNDVLGDQVGVYQGRKNTRKLYLDFKLYLNKVKTIRLTEQQIRKSHAETNLSQSQNVSLQGSKTSKNADQGSSMPVQSGNIQINRKQSQRIKTIRKIIEVDKRRLYLNMSNIGEIDCFKRLLFSDCQYFSLLEVFIGSIYLGTRFRLHAYGLTQFIQMEEPIKINQHLQSIKGRELMCNNIDKMGEFISRSIGLPQTVNSIADYGPRLLEFQKKYQSSIESSLSSLKIRIKAIEKLSEHLHHDKTIKIPQNYPLLHHCLELDLHLKNFTNLKQLQNYYNTTQQLELYYEIYKEILDMHRYVAGIWQQFMQLILRMGIGPFNACLQKHLQKENRVKKNNAIVHEEITENIRKNHHEVYLKRREEVLDCLQVYEEDDVYHPFIMIEGYEAGKKIVDENKDEVLGNNEVTSLVVFVHGYQGSDYDLEKAKNYMSLYEPKSYGLLIKSIQDEIDEDLEHLGQKVAEQIKNHLRITTNNYQKINFIGYSLGGVILRESFRHLEDYKSKMNLFISFASPHLGVIQSDNALVGTGVWYLININKVKNLKQLNCENIDKIQQKNSSQRQRMSAAEQQERYSSFLENLATSKSLEWFNKVVVVSSKEDNFVPYYSSRIDALPQLYTNDERIIRMSANILKRVKKMERVQVWFDVQHDINTFDKMTGRRAHIQFLENRIFLDLFFRMYAHQL